MIIVGRSRIVQSLIAHNAQNYATKFAIGSHGVSEQEDRTTEPHTECGVLEQRCTIVDVISAGKQHRYAAHRLE